MGYGSIFRGRDYMVVSSEAETIRRLSCEYGTVAIGLGVNLGFFSLSLQKYLIQANGRKWVPVARPPCCCITP